MRRYFVNLKVVKDQTRYLSVKFACRHKSWLFFMKYYSDKSSIIISYTDSDWKKLLKSSNVSILENEESVKKVFSLAFEWFISGKYSIDDLSAVCMRLFDILQVIGSNKYPELFDALEAGSELSFYIRKVNLLPEFTKLLEDIFDIYEGLNNL